jgi:hypothetical protein
MRRHLSIIAFVFSLPAAAMASITGFSGFAPVNAAQNSGPSTDASIGYDPTFSTFQITDFNQSEQTSGYYATPVDISSFSASFTYTSIPGINGGSNLAANGIGFNLLNASTGAATLSGIGNADGLGITGVTNSASVLFNNYGGYYNYGGSTVLQTGGNVPGPTDGSWKSISPVNLASGDALQVSVSYSAGTLRESVTDPLTGASYKTAYTGLNLASTLGASTAYVGFSGSTGGYVSNQSVTHFSFSSGTGSPVLPPVSSTAVFSPIAVSGFNKTIVVPASATVATATNYINTSVDDGAKYSPTSSGYTFFETGMSGSPAGTGLPASGSTFVSAVDSRHTFTMPTYNESGTGTSDSLVLDYATPTGSLAFATPTAYSALSFLVSAGHGPVYVDVVANYANGTSVDLGDLVAKDWFFNTPYAYSAGARLDAAGQSFSTSGGNVNLYQYDLALPASTTPIASLSFNYDGPSDTGGDNGTAIIFAVSGAPVVPEPTTTALLALAATGTLSRRRR